MNLEEIKNRLPEFEILETEDKLTTDIITVKCSKGHIEQHLLSNLLEGYGCRACHTKPKYDFWENIPEDYYELYDLTNTVYVNKRTKINYICKKHGLRTQLPFTFLESGCAVCGKERGASKRKNCQPASLESFIEKSKTQHGDKYDYSLIKEYHGKRSIVPIICRIHGEFKQEARVHYSGSGCPFCKESKGEKIIRLYLEKNNINFEKPKKYTDLRDKDLLSYDFYLPNYNLLIEYNGRQHYEKVNWDNKTIEEELNSNLEIQQKHDKMKLEYAKNNNINLLVIPYTEFDNIEEILNAEIHKYSLS